MRKANKNETMFCFSSGSMTLPVRGALFAAQVLYRQFSQ